MTTPTSATLGSGSGSSYIDSLVWGCQWTETGGAAQGSVSNPINVTYSFGSGSIPGWSYNAYPFDSAELTAFTTAMSIIESVCNIDFVQTQYTSNYSYQSNIVFYCVDSYFFGDSGVLGMFEVPDGTYSSNYGYFNWQGASWTLNGSYNLLPGSDGFNTIIHELGHGLGLAHPHDGGYGDNPTVFPGVDNSGDTGDYGLNQGIWTVMSYNSDWDSQPGAANYSYGYGILGAFDIAALQAIYGVNTAYNTGSNTYYLPTANAVGTGWFSLWDAGGVDAISNYGSSLSCSINLNHAALSGANASGHVSMNAGIAGGFTIANGVLIENAIGGLGNDTLTGNEQANTLDGGAGNDTLIGGAGDDTYVVDSTSDVVTEGAAAGTDLVQVAIATSGGTYLLGANIENATLTNSVAYNLTGNALNNTLTGNAQDNTLKGEAGNDTIVGGAELVQTQFR